MRTTVFLFLLVMTFAVPAVCFAGNPIVETPEPATGLLLLAGGASIAGYRKLRANKK
jgi:hypothetical protein